MNNKNKQYIYISIACFIMGMLLISIQKNWIVFRFSSYNLPRKINQPSFSKKEITMFFWKNNHWNSEKTNIIWSSDQATNITNTVQNWLVLLEEEDITINKISLQSALITQSEQTAYLSFDQTLFNKNHNTYLKLMLVESLLKTLRENGIKTPNIQILAHHQLIKDSHLDFSQAWPLLGFTS